MTAILMLTAVASAAMLVPALLLSKAPVGDAAVARDLATPADHAERLLAARYARGEISAYDYYRVREVLYS